MSDGDGATPGRPHSGDGGSALPGGADTPDATASTDNDGPTRSHRAKPLAAPWEREIDTSKRDSRDYEQTGPVTVADLIAKINGEAPPTEPKRHRAADDTDSDDTDTDTGTAGRAPEPVSEPEPEPYPDTGDFDTTILPVIDPPTSEIPDLTALRPARRTPAPRLLTHHRAVVVGRVAAALAAVLALVLTGGAWQWQSAKNNLLNRVSALDPDSRDIVDPNAQFGDENFLIVGTDSRLGDNAEIGAGTTEDAAGARSDTVMLVNIPANRKRVVAVSFPRDLEIEPMKCEPWDPETREYGPIQDPESPMYGKEQVYTEYKLNSAFAVGGPKCLVKVIQKLSGLHVNRFMAVDFVGFSKMVDALGGVEVCTTEPIEDYELGTVLATAGRQVVNGATALNYVRARQVTTETNGDYGRIKRQQLFLSSLLRSLISKETFFSLSKLNNVVNLFINDSYVDNVNTKDLVDLGQSVQGVNAGRITFVTVPTVGYADEWGNEIPRLDDMRALFSAIINDDPLPEERNADNTPVPGTPESLANATTGESGPSDEIVDAVTTDPENVTVQVSNSTATTGLGATAAAALQAHGFNVTTPDDYPGPLPRTTVFFSPGNEEAAATVASSFADATLERTTGLGDVVQVVLGSDFDAVAAPSPSGSAVQVHIIRGTRTPTTELPEDLTVTNAADTSCE
ncbi:transcriptional regulator [Mycolicibacterium parafortuitum]|uniref:Transcriptional regulator n=1 Tax=Mycolicibacterium parafortuitum TaxID=39692 RepID=A0A7I7U214_MYCPF|nr:LCP family protein [Mycolicibacterium parafortuitum]BBY75392.1 transcriptional regulator [Mycolicibacterium parafortuitum]